ncbi:ECF RNA polymerase sigma factor SigW [Kordia sp. SMS9]|uniref:RNA polymerase sigma factor n=1 Tax=Kordia sp. SMS9 TaxID=2282170 RepID=UPI000E0DBCAA|nr:sigma-70 family RNA polymerase sigma factor [Kordia sp. SMS9]AXG71073.1 ECF RNA polymerase sigma factor SigW [Kordia sp. SMS9]
MNQQHSLLIKKCKKGNRKAQMKLYDLYADAMFAITCRYISNKENAKDVMQEAFLKAFTRLSQYKEEVAFGAWLKRIVINQSMDTLKKRALVYEEMNDQTLAIVDDDASWEIEVSVTKQEILHSINTLPNKYKYVLQLYLIEGYDHQEISEILEIPVRTSRTQLMRGKTKLKKTLHDLFKHKISL